MTRPVRIRLALASSIVASLLIVMGDTLLLGYQTNPADYPLFSETYADQLDVNFATPQLTAPAERLMLGSLLIALCIPLLLPGVWLVRQTFSAKDTWYATVVHYSLTAGVVLTPLLHSRFFFLGEIHQAILQTDAVAHPRLIEAAQHFTTVVYTGWAVAMALLTLGWVAYAVCIFLGKTHLPKWAGLLSPFVLMILLIQLIKLLPETISIALSGASLSLAYLLFFIACTLLFRSSLLVNHSPAEE